MKARRGARAYRAGLAAEESAARWYEGRGGAILARRWRAPEGEIDLVIRLGDVIVFAEVKTGAAAVRRDAITERQWKRLEAAALRYTIAVETGAAAFRFDAVFVDAQGAVDVVENARGFD